MLNGENVTIGVSDTSVTVNGIPVLADLLDLYLSNGVVHGISGVLLPSFVSETIATVGLKEGATTLGGLMESSGLIGFVNETIGQFTVFAPSNQAFDDLSLQLLGSLTNPANVQLLIGTLSYHVVRGVYSFDAIPEGTTVLPTLADGFNVTITKTNGVVMVNDATVTSPDLLAING